MRARYLLDTNTVSYVLKRRSIATLTRLEEVRGHADICISCVTEAELLYGYRSAGVGPDRFRSLEIFFARIDILPWAREEAAAYADLRVLQEHVGKALGPLDMLIVAHAYATNSILVTHDTAMKRAQLAHGIEDWTTDI